jgi:hypothetical protein
VAARTCPSVYVMGDVHTVIGAPSSEHWKTAFGSSAVNVNVGVVSVVATAGPSWIVTTGGVMSPMSQLYAAGVGSTLPSAPRARTRSSCEPIAKPE